MSSRFLLAANALEQSGKMASELTFNQMVVGSIPTPLTTITYGQYLTLTAVARITRISAISRLDVYTASVQSLTKRRRRMSIGKFVGMDVDRSSA